MSRRHFVMDYSWLESKVLFLNKQKIAIEKEVFRTQQVLEKV